MLSSTSVALTSLHPLGREVTVFIFSTLTSCLYYLMISKSMPRSSGFGVFSLLGATPLKSVDARSSARYDSSEAPGIGNICSCRLKGHKRKSSNNPPHSQRNAATVYNCPVVKCEKTYSRSERLRGHIRSSKDTEHQIHSVKLDDYKCKECGKKCANAGGLTRHNKWCEKSLNPLENPHQPQRKYTLYLRLNAHADTLRKLPR